MAKKLAIAAMLCGALALSGAATGRAEPLEDVVEIVEEARDAVYLVAASTGQKCAQTPYQTRAFPDIGYPNLVLPGTASWTWSYHYCWIITTSGARDMLYGWLEDVAYANEDFGWSYDGYVADTNYTQDNCAIFKFTAQFSFHGIPTWHPSTSANPQRLCV